MTTPGSRLGLDPSPQQAWCSGSNNGGSGDGGSSDGSSEGVWQRGSCRYSRVQHLRHGLTGRLCHQPLRQRQFVCLVMGDRPDADGLQAFKPFDGTWKALYRL